MKTPFKINGIYAIKINPEEKFSNYKPTKLGNMWKAAIGDKEEACYEVLSFTKNYNYSKDNSEENEYCADYSNIMGEIFSIADSPRNYHCAKYINVEFNENSFVFGDDKLSFSGRFFEDTLRLHIKNIKTGETISQKLRFIPEI